LPELCGIKAFEEAECIDHNQSLGEPEDYDHAVAEQADRFDQAIKARRTFKIVPPPSESTD